MTERAAVLVIVPVLRRPHRVAALLGSLEAATPEPHHVLFIASPGDTAEQDAVRAEGADLLVLNRDTGPGDYARKINHAYRETTEPWLFTGADDLHFHPGWLPAALAEATPGVAVIGTNDLSNARVRRGEHATHSLIARSYIDEHGTIDEPGKALHEGYPHEFVDDELVQTARHRNAWAFAAHSHVEHLHPLYGKAPTDPIYDEHARRMTVGRRLFETRRHLWT